MKLLIPAEVLKAATVYTSKDETRYNINCLLFESGKVIATNGHSMLIWKHGATLSNEGGQNPDFLMAFDKTSLKFLKAADKGVLAFHYDTETRVLTGGYGQSIMLHEPPEITDFPKWRKAMPDVQNLTPCLSTIGTEIIAHYAEYMKARKGKGVNAFTLLTTSKEGGFFIMPEELTDCFIVAMPARTAQTLAGHLETISTVLDIKINATKLQNQPEVA